MIDIGELGDYVVILNFCHGQVVQGLSDVDGRVSAVKVILRRVQLFLFLSIVIFCGKKLFEMHSCFIVLCFATPLLTFLIVVSCGTYGMIRRLQDLFCCEGDVTTGGITQALDNLAMAAISDCDVVAQLTNINQQLTTTNNNLSEQLQTVLAKNAELVAKLDAAPIANTATVPKTMAPSAATSGRRPWDKAAWIASINPNGYCWTHGYRVTTVHDSKNCKGKLLGHVDATTSTDTRGRSIKNKPN